MAGSEGKTEKHQTRTLGTSESGQPRYSGKTSTQMGGSFLGGVFVKTGIVQAERHGWKRHPKVMECK
jgi:hypothetical protein